MQEEQEPPDPQPDPQPGPTDPAFTFTAGEDPAKAAKAAQAKKKVDQRKAQRAQKALEAGRLPHQAGRRPGPRNLRDEHEARFELHAQQHDLDRQDFVTITAEHYLMLVDFARCSLPKDFASEFDRIITRPSLDCELRARGKQQLCLWIGERVDVSTHEG